MAKAYTMQEFEELMGRMDEINSNLRGYLFDAGYARWSRVHSTIKRTWTMTSNIAESINNTIRDARKLSVVSLMDYMRETIQIWNAKHNEEGRNTFTVLTKKYNEMVNDNEILSHQMTVRAST